MFVPSILLDEFTLSRIPLLVKGERLFLEASNSLIEGHIGYFRLPHLRYDRESRRQLTANSGQ